MSILEKRMSKLEGSMVIAQLLREEDKTLLRAWERLIQAKVSIRRTMPIQMRNPIVIPVSDWPEGEKAILPRLVNMWQDVVIPYIDSKATYNSEQGTFTITEHKEA